MNSNKTGGRLKVTRKNIVIFFVFKSCHIGSDRGVYQPERTYLSGQKKQNFRRPPAEIGRMLAFIKHQTVPEE
jgi:hypothetical protein